MDDSKHVRLDIPNCRMDHLTDSIPGFVVSICTWDGERLILQADNDYDPEGLALLDEFSDNISAFISAFLCVRWLLRFISSHDFVPFAWYRIAFGIVVLMTWHFGWVNWTVS